MTSTTILGIVLGPAVAAVLFGGTTWLCRRYLPSGRLKTILFDPRIGKGAAWIVYGGIAVWFLYLMNTV